MAAKTSGTGLSKNTAGALAYVLGPITRINFLVLEKDPFVRCHAMQSIVVFVGLTALQWAMGLTLILLPIVPLIGLVGFILWLLLIYKAWQGEEFSVPVFGQLAKQLIGKM